MAILICLTFLAASCQPAALFVNGNLLVDPGFEVSEPDPEQWELTRNRRWNGEPQVVYRHREERSVALSLKLLLLPPAAAGVPLEVLAEVSFMAGNVASGVEAELFSTLPIVVGAYSAVATYGTWTIRPMTKTVTQVSIRSPDGMVVITLLGDAEAFDSLIPDLDYLLRSLKLKTSTPVDPFLLDMIPFEDPDQDPGRFVP